MATQNSWNTPDLDTKGQILVGTTTRPIAVSVGANNLVLTADNTEASGVKWSATAGIGDVVGPAVAIDNAFSRYDGVTGKLIQGSGVLCDDANNLTSINSITLSLGTNITEFSTDTTLGGDSDNAIPTEKAIKTYVDTVASGDVTGPAGATDNAFPRFDTGTGKLLQNSGVLCDDANNLTAINAITLNIGANINEFSTDGTLAGNSDTAVPTEKAVKTYVDNAPFGDVVGPAGATDNAISKYDGATGKIVQNSVGILTDAGDLTGIKSLTLTDALTVPYGGTGLQTITDGGILLGSGVGAITVTAQPTNGQLLIGSTGVDPVLGTITAGEAIDVTLGAGSVTILCEDWSTVNKGVGELATDAEALLAVATDKAIVPSSLNAVLSPIVFSGFASWGGAGAYYSVAGTTLTLERAGVGYIKSVQIPWAGAQDTGALVKGATYWVYIDDTGTIGSTDTRTAALFRDNIVLFEVLVDNDAAANVMVVKENHPYDYQVHVSNDLHDIIHTVLEGTGAVIAVSGVDDIELVGADELHDHGLETEIPDSGGNPETFSFMFTDAGGKWVRDSQATSFPSEYNSAGTMTALDGGKYGTWRLYVSKDDLNTATPTYYAVADTAQYNNLITARNAIASGTPAATTELAALELAQLGFIIYAEATSSIVEVEVARSIVGNVTTGASAATAALTTVDTSLFDGWLSAVDSTVQTALETLDETGKDGTFYLENTAAATKRLNFDLSGIAAGNDRTITMANSAIDLTPSTGSFEAADAALLSIATNTGTGANKGIYYTGADVAAEFDLTAAGLAILDDANATAQRATLGLVIGTNVQAYSATLKSIADNTGTGANKGIYYTGAAVAAEFDLTAAGLAILDDADASAQRSTLGLAIGSNVQAWDAQLDDIAALAFTNSNFIVGDGANWVVESGATARTSLGLGTIATQDSNNVTITGGSITAITDIVVGDGGTGLSVMNPYAVLCGGTGAATALQSLASLGNANEVLTSNGAAALPSWQATGAGAGDVTAGGNLTDNAIVRGDGGAKGVQTSTILIDDSDNVSGILALSLGGDITDYDAVNDASPEIRLGSADAEELHIQSVYDGGAQTLDYVLFQTDAASGTANKGLFRFNVDGSAICDIDDGGIDLDTGGALSVNGTDVLTATTLGANVVNSSLTQVGTIATGTWSATDVAVAAGGTGRSTGTIAYGVICTGTTATNPQQTVNGLGDADQVLTSNGAGALPSWQAGGGGGAIPDAVFGGAAVDHRINTTTAFASREYVDLGTVELYVRAFDDTTEEYMQDSFRVPDDITAGNVTFEVHGWSETAAASKNVQFTFGHRALADSEAIDGAYSDDDSGDLAVDATQDDLDILTWTETVANLGWTAGDLVLYRFSRIDATADDLADDYYVYNFLIRIPRA